MNSNPEAFLRHYLPATSFPIALQHGWTIERVHEDRIRWAVDLALRHAGGARVICYVERRVEGRRSLAATEHLAVSYYEPDTGVDERLLAQSVREFAKSLASREKALAAGALDEIFHQGDGAGQRFKDYASHPIELRINRDCNEDCLFCNTPPDSNAILEGRDQVLSEMQRFYELGHRAVTFTGREPTLDPNLEDYVRRAKATGYTHVRLQTNGTAFASRPVLERLVAAGLDRVQISLHTLKESTFSVLVGKPRLLEKAREGLRHMLEFRQLECEALCVVTAMNVGELEEFTRTLADEHRGKHLELVFSPMAPQGDGEKHPELLARLRDLGPSIGRALAIAREAGFTARIPHRCGMPLCVTPPEFHERNMSFYAEPGDNLEGGKKKSPKCRECVFDERCVGVWKHYLEMFGDEELVPLKTLPAAPRAEAS